MNVNYSSKLNRKIVATVILLLMTLSMAYTPKTTALSQLQTQCDTTGPLNDADPNESAGVADIYWGGVEFMRLGNWEEAQIWFAKGISQYPKSRHLHEGMTQVLWFLATKEPANAAALEDAAYEIVQTVKIGLDFGKVRHTWLLAQTLGRTGDIDTLDSIFKQAIAIDPTFETYLHYAIGLSILEDPRAETMYQQALILQPKDNIDALASYGEWLLDHKNEDQVLTLLPANSHIEYLHFLRGVALERLGRLNDARLEYAQFAAFSNDFPAPGRYQIPDSRAQSDIKFEGGIATTATNGQGQIGLSTLIYGEANGESSGSQRAMGWVVRNRVLRGSVGGCPYVTNNGSTLADKYKSVMCQSGQFYGMCSAWCNDPTITSCARSTTTDHNAYDVWYGYAPDPVKSGGYCPNGYQISTCPDGVCDPCQSVTHCWGSTSGYSTQGGLFNIGTSGSCSAHSCAPTSRNKVCGNGGLDNCFYTNP